MGGRESTWKIEESSEEDEIYLRCAKKVPRLPAAAPPATYLRTPPRYRSACAMEGISPPTFPLIMPTYLPACRAAAPRSAAAHTPPLPLSRLPPHTPPLHLHALPYAATRQRYTWARRACAYRGSAAARRGGSASCRRAPSRVLLHTHHPLAYYCVYRTGAPRAHDDGWGGRLTGVISRAVIRRHARWRLLTLRASASPPLWMSCREYRILPSMLPASIFYLYLYLKAHGGTATKNIAALPVHTATCSTVLAGAAAAAACTGEDQEKNVTRIPLPPQFPTLQAERRSRRPLPRAWL